MATLQQAIDIAYPIINDTGTQRRVSQADMLQYANDALDAIAVARPELFYETVRITCIQGTTVQRLSQTDSLGLVDIYNIENGGAVLETTRSLLDQFNPGWFSDPAGPAQNWVRMGDDPFRFFIYPQAPANQVLVGEHIRVPLEYAATDTHLLSNTYTPIIAHYIVAMAESRDDEHVLSQRAAQFLQLFWQELGVANVENAAEKPK